MYITAKHKLLQKWLNNIYVKNLKAKLWNGLNHLQSKQKTVLFQLELSHSQTQHLFSEH